MKKVIRLNERDLTRIIKRVINEQRIETMDPLPTPAPNPKDIADKLKNMLQNQSSDLPNCSDLLTSSSSAPGGGSSLQGPFDSIEYNGTVSPAYQGYTVMKGGKPFCFIHQG